MISEQFTCPECQQPVKWAFGEQTHPDDPKYGVTVWCGTPSCVVKDSGHGKNERQAYAWLRYLYGYGAPEEEPTKTKKLSERELAGFEEIKTPAPAKVPGDFAVKPGTIIDVADPELHKKMEKHNKVVAPFIQGNKVAGEFTTADWADQHSISYASASIFIRQELEKGNMKLNRTERRNPKGPETKLYVLVEGKQVSEKKAFEAPKGSAPGEFSVKEYGEQKGMSYPVAFLEIKAKVAKGEIVPTRTERRAARGPETQLYRFK